MNKIRALVGLMMLLTACSSQDPSAGDTTTIGGGVTTTAAIESTTTSPATSTTSMATTTTAAEPVEVELAFIVPLTFAIPPDWQASVQAESHAVAIQAPPGAAAFANEGSDKTVESWVDEITGQANLVTTEPEATEVGGAPGLSFDARTVANASEGQICDGATCVAITSIPGQFEWYVMKGYPNRIWIVDVDGTTVLIAAEASEATFDAFVAEFEETLATIQWGGG